MLFESTNLLAEKASFSEALIQGQAPDKGLYVPEQMPQFTEEEIAAFPSKKYPEIAAKILSKFVEEISEKEMQRLCVDAYDYEVPLEKIGGVNCLFLDRGPTASFKDFGARMMARLMNVLREPGQEIVILTATSGDTGSAVASAYYGLQGIKVVVLFPRGRVTELQRKQMTTLGGNVLPVEVNGVFDDCQRLVKQAFNDTALKSVFGEKTVLSSANSINIGRLLPQSVYYSYAASRLEEGEVVFSVPSGNFGNITSALIAKRMGLPVKRLVASLNSNNTFKKFLDSGQYAPQKTVETISNAMDVGHPSNLARIIHFYGGQMNEKGEMIKQPDLAGLRKDFYVSTATDEETREEIRRTWKKDNILLDPHGAVARIGLERFLAEEGHGGPSVFLETASPAKFPEVVTQETGQTPTAAQLERLSGKQEHYQKTSAEYGEFKQLLLKSLS